MLPDQLGSNPAERRRDDALAQAESHRHADHTYTVHHLFAWQGFFILCGHDGHIVTAFDKRPRQPLSVNGQAGGVRTVISKNSQYFHRAGRLYPSQLQISLFEENLSTWKTA